VFLGDYSRSSVSTYQVHVYRSEQVPSKYHGKWKVERDEFKGIVEFKDYEAAVSPVVSTFGMAPPLARLVASYLDDSAVVPAPAPKPEAGSALADFFAPPAARQPIVVDDDDDMEGLFG
jgi:hypothetical protein